MAYFGKEFALERDENFKEFIESLGLPDDKVNFILKHKSVQKLVKSGDEYTLVINTDGANSKEIKFRDGVEFDEQVSEGIIAKTTFKVDGNVITQVQKYDDGRSLTFKREYSDNKLVVTLTSSFWDGSARRYYVPV